MGCVKSSAANDGQPDDADNRLRKPKPWKHADRKVSASQLEEMRNLFWRNAPSAYGGKPRAWEAIKEAVEITANGLEFAQQVEAILDMHRVTLGNPPDMTVCYDEDGHRYNLPLYVVSNPTNMEGARKSIKDRFRGMR